MEEKRYELIKQIGKGATSCVYKAKDCVVGRIVAIKIINNLEIGRHECSVLQGLHHKGIPNLFDYYEEDDKCFLVMEFVEGKSLREMKEQKDSIDEKKCLHYLIDLSEILLYLHNLQNPVIYMDLKPENIVIGKNNQLYLIDYGAACVQCEKVVKWYGTPSYAPPELLQDDINEEVILDERVDIYSLGSVGIFMRTGVLKGELPYGMIVDQLKNYFIDQRLETILTKCVSAEREKRYGNMKEVLFYMKKCTRGNRFKHIWNGIVSSIYYVMVIISAYFIGSFLNIINLLEWKSYEKEIQALSGMVIATVMFELLVRRKFRGTTNVYKSVTHFIQMSSRVGACILLVAILSTELKTYSKEMQAYPIGLSVVEEPGRMMLIKDGEIYGTNDDVILKVGGFQQKIDYEVSYNYKEWIPLDTENITIPVNILKNENSAYSVRVKSSFQEYQEAEELLLAYK